MAQTLFCTLDELKRYLGIDAGDTSKDDLLNDLLSDASTFIEDQTGRHFGGTLTVTDEQHDYNQSGIFFTDKMDVQSVTALKTGIPTSLTTQPADSYVVEGTGRVLLGRVQPFDTAPWVNGNYQSVFISYTYGRPDVPGDVKQATKQLAAAAYLESPAYQASVAAGTASQSVKSERIGNYQVQYANPNSEGLLSDTMSKLPKVQEVISYWKVRRAGQSSTVDARYPRPI